MQASRALNFFKTVGKLKTLKRTGWVRDHIHLPESVADHMYRMSMMTLMITDASINKDRLMKICMVHDLAESIVGDITPDDPITKAEKRKLEEDALRGIVVDLQYPDVADEILALWLEYEQGITAEASLAKQLDKLEMIIQADEYERENQVLLQTYFDSTASSFSHPEVLAWASELRGERSRRLASRNSDRIT